MEIILVWLFFWALWALFVGLCGGVFFAIFAMWRTIRPSAANSR